MTMSAPETPVVNAGSLYISGLKLSVDQAAGQYIFDVSAGACRDSTNTKPKLLVTNALPIRSLNQAKIFAIVAPRKEGMHCNVHIHLALKSTLFSFLLFCLFSCLLSFYVNRIPRNVPLLSKCSIT